MQNPSYEIGSAVAGTCEWLRRHEKYTTWAACDRGLLWIKGKPGSGKSTLLKYALDSYGGRNSDLVLAFFFHGRGDELQRTLFGLFRSLLHQILRRAPHALSDLVNTFEKRCKDFGKPGEKWQWHEEELRRVFESSLLNVLETYPVWLFVDALDECGEDNAVKLVDMFKSLLKSIPSQSIGIRQFRICFSCRHYPVLDLEREGAGSAKIEAAVYSIPRDLDELYRQLIRSMEPASLKLIQWICFATRPLSTDELRWAMVIEADCPHRSLQACQSEEEYVSDNVRMKRQVQTLSRGLAEVTHAQDVQFIHQSVKDFFVEKGLSALDGSVTSTEVAIRAHFRFSRICIRYLAMEEIGRSTSYNDSDFPFLRYAVTSWVACAGCRSLTASPCEALESSQRESGRRGEPSSLWQAERTPPLVSLCPHYWLSAAHEFWWEADRSPAARAGSSTIRELCLSTWSSC
ncbi:hypothetical protein B0T24DRAFT_320290 [Lasiosphaeria ovina]|uniref:NACHT domain-containing protein n=1 Tax=Lasiosphaeria ovina TaxID=92902 RepID=A0AAE0K7F5_9PEZI|nr:hypothetical protein B0T24DRAFT_320290 [Lasiosphaeria ovina]